MDRWRTALALACFTLLRPACVSASATEKNVLILESFATGGADSVDFLESQLRLRASGQVNFYVEHLESRRFDDEAYEKAVADTLEDTYRGQKLDLVMPGDYPALQFAVRHRNALFPRVPIVFYEVGVDRITGQKMWPR